MPRTPEPQPSVLDNAASHLWTWAVQQAYYRAEVRDHEVAQGELVYHDPDGLL
jgi:hypothetical protein